MYISPHEKYRLFLLDFNETNCQENFEKYSIITFHETPSNGSRALKIIDVGIFLFLYLILIPFPVHFLFKWTQKIISPPSYYTRKQIFVWNRMLEIY